MSQPEQLQSLPAESQGRLRRPTNAEEIAPRTSLDARLAELRRRIRRTATRPLPTSSASAPQRPPAMQKPSFPLTKESQKIRQSLSDELQRLRSFANESGGESAELDGALRLASLAVGLIDDRSGSPAEQLAMAPALEEIRDHLRSRIEEKLGRAQRRRADDELVGLVARLHADLAAGAALDYSRLRNIADAVRADAETNAGRMIDCRSSFPESVAAHGVNVARTIAFLTQKEIRRRAFQEQLVAAALVQDAGMLSKHDDADDPRMHPLAAELALEQCDGFDKQFARAAARHHERLDGSGFPRGLKGQELSTPDRLAAIAESYCSHRRRFRESGPEGPRAALMKTLAEAEAGLLDVEFAAQLLDLGLYPAGTFVELATGEIAEVVANQEASKDPKLAALPVVRIVRNVRGERQAPTTYRNLAQRADCRIVRSAHESEA